MPAIEALTMVIENWDHLGCEHCGRPNLDERNVNSMIRSAQLILDRTGMGPRATLEVTTPAGQDLDVEQMTDDERIELGELLSRLATLKAAVKARLNLANSGAILEGRLLTEGETDLHES